MKAITNIMANMYIDCYFVGDILPSFRYEYNGLRYLLNKNFEDKFIEKEILPQVNICRRFTDYRLINFVNSIVDFNKYGLNEITPHEEKT